MGSDKVAWPSTLSGPSHLILPWTKDKKARPLIVFFGAKDLLEEQFNFHSLGREIPTHRIFLNNGSNAWYQGGIPQFARDFDNCSRMIDAWACALQASEICCVGTSMGGYGAVLHGTILGARVLAFSTDHVIGAQGSRSAQYYDGPNPVPRPDLAAAITAAASGFSLQLIVGERDAVDLLSAARLKGLESVAVRSVVGADHYVPSCLSRRGHLNRLLQSFAKGETPDLPMQGRALDHPDHVAKTHEALLALNKGDNNRAVNLARAALDIFPDGEAACLIKARALQKLARHDEAINAFAQALIMAPNEVTTLSILAQSLRQCGRLVSARALHDHILMLSPGRHGSHYALGLISRQEGLLAQALAETQRALQGAPSNVAYRRQLKVIQMAIASKAATKEPDSFFETMEKPPE